MTTNTANAILFWFAELLHKLSPTSKSTRHLWHHHWPFYYKFAIDFPLLNISCTSTHRLSKIVDCTPFILYKILWCTVTFQICYPSFAHFLGLPFKKIKKKFPAAPLNEFRGFLLWNHLTESQHEKILRYTGRFLFGGLEVFQPIFYSSHKLHSTLSDSWVSRAALPGMLATSSGGHFVGDLLGIWCTWTHNNWTK